MKVLSECFIFFPSISFIMGFTLRNWTISETYTYRNENSLLVKETEVHREAPQTGALKNSWRALCRLTPLNPRSSQIFGVEKRNTTLHQTIMGNHGCHKCCCFFFFFSARSYCCEFLSPDNVNLQNVHQSKEHSVWNHMFRGQAERYKYSEVKLCFNQIHLPFI